MLVAAVSWSITEALEEIYRRHGAAVYALARRLLGDRTRAAAVVQEVFVDLWSGPERFDAVVAEDVGGRRQRGDASVWPELPDDGSQAIELAGFAGATYVDVAMLLERSEEGEDRHPFRGSTASAPE